MIDMDALLRLETEDCSQHNCVLQLQINIKVKNALQFTDYSELLRLRVNVCYK